MLASCRRRNGWRNTAPHGSALTSSPASRWRLRYPVSLAYAGLAGLPPQVGIYGYMLGGLAELDSTGSSADTSEIKPTRHFLSRSCRGSVRVKPSSTGSISYVTDTLRPKFPHNVTGARFCDLLTRIAVPAIIMPGLAAFRMIVLFNRGEMLDSLQASATCAFGIGALAAGLATVRLFQPGIVAGV